MTRRSIVVVWAATALLGAIGVLAGALFLLRDATVQPGAIVVAPTHCGSVLHVARSGVPSHVADAEPGATPIPGTVEEVERFRQECRKVAVRQVIVGVSVLSAGGGLILASAVGSICATWDGRRERRSASGLLHG